MKAQHERADNCTLRSDNDRIRCENIAMREALRNIICPSCGGPPVTEDSYFDEQKLRMENAQLKEELDRVSSIAAKYIGRPISQLPPVQPIHVSSLGLSMASFASHGMSSCPSLDLDLDLDLLPGSSLGVASNLQFPPMNVSDVDKSVMADIASSAMDELIRLFQGNEMLWMKSASDGRELLNLESYERVFPRPNTHLKDPSIHTEASRSSGVVIMNDLALVDVFVDANKWMDMFPAIVSRSARTIEVISSGMLGSHSGRLQLMYAEVQMLSALVPPRKLYFLRFVQQIEAGSWVVADVSYDIPNQDGQFSSTSKAHKLPSGCLIQEMPNGYSKVTWIEHWEVEDKSCVHRLYREVVQSGLAFGAERWVADLQRMCERMMVAAGNSNAQVAGMNGAGAGGNNNNSISNSHLSAEGRRSMMKLAERMVNNFCASINPSPSPSPSPGQHLTTVIGSNEVEVRATLHRSPDPGHPNGMVLSAAATIWLPVSPQNVFNYLTNETTRPQWDVLLNENAVEEIAHIGNGSHPGNCISVLRALNNMLILQESWVDCRRGWSVVVYCPVDIPSISIATSGHDTSVIPLLPSGFTISPDAPADGAEAGSLVTVVFQIQVSNMPTARISPDTLNNLIGNTLHQIKAAMTAMTTA